MPSLRLVTVRISGAVSAPAAVTSWMNSPLLTSPLHTSAASRPGARPARLKAAQPSSNRPSPAAPTSRWRRYCLLRTPDRWTSMFQLSRLFRTDGHHICGGVRVLQDYAKEIARTRRCELEGESDVPVCELPCPQSSLPEYHRKC